MSCVRVPLFTKVTREPTGTVRDLGDTPLAVIVIVVPLLGEGVGVGVGVGEGDGDGVVGEESPPHAATVSTVASATQPNHVNVVRIRKISSRY